MTDSDLERLRRECLRLSNHLAREKERNSALQQAVRATLSSVTFKVASRANRILSRLLGMARGATAWDQLPALLQRSDLDGTRNTIPTLSATPLMHAEASCNAAGLSMLGNRLSSGYLLVLGELPPFDIALNYRQASAADDLSTFDDCWAILVVPGDGHDVNKLFSAADAAARIFQCPLAVWSSNEKQTIPSAARNLRPESEAGAGPRDYLGFHRSLGQLLADSRSNSDVPFTEAAYLRSNPDVVEAIAAKDFESARDHWDLIGQYEFASGSRRCELRRDEASLGLRKASESLIAQATKEWENWDLLPRISVLVPVYRVDIQWLKACVESVVGQIYPHWQLCIVDDGSGDVQIAQYLNSLDDPRISVQLQQKNCGISEASNNALAMAKYEHVALLDHDDELTVDALWLIARVINHHDPDIIYSDEAKLDDNNRVVEPHFKPDFSWVMLLSQNYMSHLGVYRTSLVRDVQGFRKGYEGSQDHDLLLRVAAKSERVFHITRILYYWRRVDGSTAQRFSDKDYAWDRGLAAVQDAISKGGLASKGTYPGTYQIKRTVVANPTVSILVPFRDQANLLEGCLNSLTEKTDYQHFEIIGINNQSQKSTTRALMQRWSGHPKVKFIDYDHAFNFSAINNVGASLSEAEHLLLLNNDIEVLEESWLEEMVSLSALPEVGAVGGLLLYPDETIQHAGAILGIGGVAGHSHKYMPVQHHGYFCRPHLTQNVSAVTGACLMVKRDLYLRAGGLDEQNLTVAFNDIDFCLRLLEMGYQNIYTPYARLVHHESKSRGAEDTPKKQKRFNKEAGYMLQRHGLALCLGDRWYNPNLSLITEDFSLRAHIAGESV